MFVAVAATHVPLSHSDDGLVANISSRRIWNLVHELAYAWFICSAASARCVCSTTSILPAGIWKIHMHAVCVHLAATNMNFYFLSSVNFPSSSFIYSYVNLIRLSWAPAKPFICRFKRSSVCVCCTVCICACLKTKKAARANRKCKTSFLFFHFFYFIAFRSAHSLSQVHARLLRSHISHHFHAISKHAAGSWRLTLWCLCHDTNGNCAMWKCSSAFYVCSTGLTRRERALMCYHKRENISVWNASDFKEST